MPARDLSRLKPRQNMPRKQKPTQPKQPKKPKRNRPKKKGKEDAKPLLKLLSILVVLGILLGCILVLLSYARVLKIRSEVTELENQKDKLIKKKEDLSAEVERIKSGLRVEEEAKTKLGMVRPNDEQVVYIDLDMENRTQKYDNILTETISYIKNKFF